MNFFGSLVLENARLSNISRGSSLPDKISSTELYRLRNFALSGKKVIQSESGKKVIQSESGKKVMQSESGKKGDAI